MRAPAVPLFVLGTAVFLSTLTAHVVAQQKINPLLLPRALDLYAQGQFDEGMRRVMTTSGFTIEDAQRWISAGGRATLERRRLVAATCALEYVGMRRFLIPRLLTWARTLVASPQGPTATEALWLRASIAIAEGSEGFGQWQFLSTGALPEPGRAVGVAPPGGIGHLTYASQRFPDDPYVKMASVVAAEYLTSPKAVARTTPFDRGAPGHDLFGGDAADPASSRTSAEARQLERAAAIAESLQSNPQFHDEAQLRLGYIQMRLGLRDDALRNFDAIVASEAKSDVRYLAHLYSGVTLARVNRTSEAASAYRAALRVVPGSRSAVTLLTSVLLMSGQSADAEAVATKFLSEPAVSDPWDRYFVGDLPQFASLVARLREALR